MAKYTIWSIAVLLLIFSLPQSAYAQCSQHEAEAGAGNGSSCQLINSFPGIHGTTCIFSPCGPDNLPITCDDNGCGTAGTTVEADDDDVTFEEIGGIPDPAGGPDRCIGCSENHCDTAADVLRSNHEQFERVIISNISGEMQLHRRWLREIFFLRNILPAMMNFTTQMTAVAMHQVMAIGQFFDAENQLRTQRTLQTLQIQAHEDYHPSESFCTFGTNVRSLAASDQKTDLNQAALASAQLVRHLGTKDAIGSNGPVRDLASRWELFRTTYCNPKDNSWKTDNSENTGLATVCGQTPPNPQRANADIDYLRLISEPRTLEVDFTNAGVNPTETDILSLSKNLYGHNLLNRQITDNALRTQAGQKLYMGVRALAAKRRVAEDSFNAIVAMKSSGSDGLSATGENAPNTNQYLYSILEELGVSTEPSAPGQDPDVEELLGKNPSYYAQLEILAKRIYQNPNFYVKLYDKPANIKRKAAALIAIERMLDQALLESQHRQEMAMSVILSSSMEREWQSIQRELSSRQN